MLKEQEKLVMGAKRVWIFLKFSVFEIYVPFYFVFVRAHALFSNKNTFLFHNPNFQHHPT